MSKDKYINFRVNGRLFPSWIMANFKKYKLPKIILNDDDPCKTTKDVKFEMHKYQAFISAYLDYKSPYRDILVYHGLGSGKTATTINIYNMLYNYTPGWNVFILLKAALVETPWKEDIKKFLTKDEYKYRYQNISFINYDSPFADKDFFNQIKQSDASKKTMFVIEECHNFINNVYSNVRSGEGRRAQRIYDYIIQNKKENNDTRVILLSGSPAINKPFELALLFNLLRPDAFPKSENLFNSLYVKGTTNKTLNQHNKNMFQRRIIGLVSYYVGAGTVPGLYARKSIHYIDVKMSEYQEDIYTYYEEIENQIARRSRGGKKSSSTYLSYTRQSSNFVFPHISQKISGEERPRPHKYRLSEREAMKEEIGQDSLKQEKGKDSYLNVNEYKKALHSYIKGFNDHLRIAHDSDLAKKHTIQNDITNIAKYHGVLENFIKKEKTISKLFTIMYNCSAKMLSIILNILLSKGPVLVYSNFVLMEGLEIFKIYLKYFGFRHYTKSAERPNYGYAEFHGKVNVQDRVKAMKYFNKVENIRGELVKIMLVSPAGTEGLSLHNVRQVHIMEPHWHEVRIFQMIGRAIRWCSHKHLPLKDRVVDVYRYKSVRATPGSKRTTDTFIENTAQNKEKLINSFLGAVKEIAIDCELFKNHNLMMDNYKCFKFAEESLFNKYIGPAYKKDLYNDMRINNGTSSSKHQVIKIKVRKITAVIQTSRPDESPKYTLPKQYWYYGNSGVVYDYEFKYPVGKVLLSKDGIPNKLDKNTYIIGELIPMPLINNE